MPAAGLVGSAALQLLAALSSWRPAVRRMADAFSLSPAVSAARKERMIVRSEDFTDWLRRRLRSLVRIRFFWDLILATRKILVVFVGIPVRAIHDGMPEVCC